MVRWIVLNASGYVRLKQNADPSLYRHRGSSLYIGFRAVAAAEAPIGATSSAVACRQISAAQASQ